MSYQIRYKYHQLHFKFKAGTSRGVMTKRDVYFITIYHTNSPQTIGLGECAPLVKLSIDDVPDYEEQLAHFCQKAAQLNSLQELYNLEGIAAFPSILTGLEMAFQDLANGGKRLLYDAAFMNSGARIPINGLVWMGTKSFMYDQIKTKLDAGFKCIKMKIGAINFDEECELLAYVRKQFAPSDITLRVDANGAFSPQEALDKLQRLAQFDIHSIEQPIKQKQWDAMAELCEKSPLPIALDEELIGITRSQKEQLLKHISPPYIILKPTLVGGFASSNEWIQLAESLNIGWWMTSALESNIGLNAIAQFTAMHQVSIPQGLGTGQLFHNNIPSPLSIENGSIFYDQSMPWDLKDCV
ncbi:MAG: o-succinylbenzoate synthase [Flammeovirgaceae bacterium]